MSNYCKNCYELQEQLDQLKEQLEAYKMEAEEGKEINAELKAELEQEKALKDTYFACYHAKHEDLAKKYDKLKQTLTEIKEIAEANKKYIYVIPSYFVAGDSLEFSFEFTKNILNKISECEVENDNA